MLKAFGRDFICMLSALIVVTTVASAVWFAVFLWFIPRTETTVKLFWLPALAPVAVAVGSVAVLFHSLLRSRARRGQWIAPPYWRETLLDPLLAGLALGLLGCAVVAIAGGSRQSAGEAFLLGLAQTVPASLAAWVVVFVQRLSRRPDRALLGAAATLGILAVGGRLALDAWGDRMFTAYRSAAMVEIAAERQRIAADRLPVLFGEPIDDNAAKRYRVVAQSLTDKDKDTKGYRALGAAVRNGPGHPRGPEVAQLIAATRPELQALREAVRCQRCDWEYPWEQGFRAPLPNLLGARMAADLLVVDGHLRIEGGDLAGAVERDLDVVRMGCDYEASGALIGTLMAFGIEGIGIDGLLQIVATNDFPAAPNGDTIRSRLDLLEPRLASVSVGYRGERLAYVGLDPLGKEATASLDWAHFPRSDFLYPGRFVQADFVRVSNAALREIEKACELKDPRDVNRLSQAAMDRALRSPNPIVHMGLPSLGRARDSQDRVTARFRMLRTAIQLEKLWGKDGRYPVDSSAIDLPIDPFGYPSRLHYTSLAEGRSYKLWSNGTNGKDDGGVAKDGADEVFERTPRVALAH